MTELLIFLQNLSTGAYKRVAYKKKIVYKLDNIRDHGHYPLAYSVREGHFPLANNVRQT